MKNKKLLILIIIILISILSYILVKNINNLKLNNNTQNKVIKENNIINNKMKIKINNKIFTATLYDNKTTRELLTHLPITINMSDLNSNEKYYYLDFNLTTNSYTPKKINSGDIKLYGNNCLVIFYDDFSNSYNYTDIGK